MDEYINSNILIDCYAGRGKSHFILNEVIPRLKKHNKSFVIICSQHQPLNQYRLAGHTCFTVASLMNQFPINIPFDTVIMDEGGLTQFEDFEYFWKVASHKWNMILLGDRHQLPPVRIDGCKLIPLENINIRKMFDYMF